MSVDGRSTPFPRLAVHVHVHVHVHVYVAQ